MSTTNRLGELLVREKLISLQQLRQAQEEQRKSGANLGYALAKLGISPTARSRASCQRSTACPR